MSSSILSTACDTQLIVKVHHLLEISQFLLVGLPTMRGLISHGGESLQWVCTWSMFVCASFAWMPVIVRLRRFKRNWKQDVEVLNSNCFWIYLRHNVNCNIDNDKKIKWFVVANGVMTHQLLVIQHLSHPVRTNNEFSNGFINNQRMKTYFRQYEEILIGILTKQH